MHKNRPFQYYWINSTKTVYILVGNRFMHALLLSYPPCPGPPGEYLHMNVCYACKLFQVLIFILVLLKILCKQERKKLNVFRGKRGGSLLHTCMHVCTCTMHIAKILGHSYLFILQIKCDGEKGNNGNQKIGFPCRSANDVEFYLNTPFFILFERI